MGRTTTEPLKPYWEAAPFVVMAMDGWDTVHGTAMGAAGLEEWLSEMAAGEAENRLAHPPDIVLVGLDDELTAWARAAGTDEWVVLIRDNRLHRAYKVSGLVSNLAEINPSMVCSANHVERVSFP